VTRAIPGRCAKSLDRERRIIHQMRELSVLDSGKIPLEYSTVSVIFLSRDPQCRQEKTGHQKTGSRNDFL
jgi:hypothetical protein